MKIWVRYIDLLLKPLDAKSIEGAMKYAFWYWNRGNVKFQHLKLDCNSNYTYDKKRIVRSDFVRARRFCYRIIRKLGRIFYSDAR